MDATTLAVAAVLARVPISHHLVDREVAVYSDYANFLFQAGRAQDAVAQWEALLSLMQAKQEPPYELAQYQFDLARALWRDGKRARAREVATIVLHVLRTEPPTQQLGGHIRRDWRADQVEDWFEDPDAWERD